MLYDEFLAGTGCRDKAYNYKIYRDLEILYMNSDLTKEEIYEYGKKLVNNDLTKAQVQWNEKIDAEIAEYKTRVENRKADLERYESNRNHSKANYWDDVDFWEKEIKLVRKDIKTMRALIRGLKATKYV